MADLEHAAEGDTDLIGDSSALNWAERFAARFLVQTRDHDSGEAPEYVEDLTGLMLAWFAGALSTGGLAERARAADTITKSCGCEWSLMGQCEAWPNCIGAERA
jgi:hypothetical protein